MESLCNPAGLRADPRGAPAPFEPPASGLEPQEYFAGGHFTAAVQRTTELIPQAADVGAALTLWYVRIQSLLFLQLGHQAADETHACLAPLEQDEFLSALPDSATRLVAWKLRLVLVPVRTKGINQSAVQLYYSLGADARAQAAQGDAEDWLRALQLAGLYAASALIAMRDYMTVVHLLSTQYAATKQDETARLLALIFIQIGDTLSARAWVSRLPPGPQAAELKALYTFADSDSGEKILPVISDVYSGRVGDAIAKLEETVATKSEPGVAMNTSLTNLFTLYDLCYADARERRAQVAHRMAAGGNTLLENVELSNEFRRALGST